MPRTMVVFAHPDDETVALGARLGRFRSSHFVHVTDGAPRNEQDSRAYGFASWREYRQARTEELDQAFRLAGLSASRECLEIPDQEASLQLVQLTRRIAQFLRRYQPEAVFTHPYEGGHPDHDACAFAVQHAVALLERDAEEIPLVVEGAFYHGGFQGSAVFLPSPVKVQEAAFRLSPEERQRKSALLVCFTTQQQTLSGFSFEWERFRIAPEYDFHKPPHPAPVHYDRYPWGMTSLRFCELAQEAETALQGEAEDP